MGVDGERIDPVEAAARQYSVTVGDLYIVVEIPFGAVGGHFKVSSTEVFQFLTKKHPALVSKIFRASTDSLRTG